MAYSIEEHRHRFSAWAASRASSVAGCRFSVQSGKKILEMVRLSEVAKSVDNLPDPMEFDVVHKKWRLDVINSANDLNLSFSHGIAAKLINIYLKSIFVCATNHTDPRVRAIHPPIDSVLLDELYKNDIGHQKAEWQSARRIRWSKLNSEEYESVILAVKKTVSLKEGLWKIEKYWQGFQ